MTNEKKKNTINLKGIIFMKKILLAVTIIVCVSCAMNSDCLSKISVVAFNKRIYSLQKDKVGKVFFPYCVKYKFLHSKKTKNCKKWKTLVVDMNNKEEYNKFFHGNFVLISLDNID